MSLNTYDLREELASALLKKESIFSVIELFGKYKNMGVTQDEAMGILESIRSEIKNDADEDWILEVMDVASGYCSIDKRIW